MNREGGIVSVSPLATEDQLYDTVFNLLGNSIEDLFFPGNFLIVEGSSDQIIVEKVLELSGVEKPKVKVISAAGVSNIKNTLSAIENTLKPLIMTTSIYSKKVVVLIDKNDDEERIDSIKKILKTRLFVLDKSSIEEYIPEDIYTRIGRNKNEDIETIKSLKGNKKELSKFKKTLSEQISANLIQEDLKNIPIIVFAARKSNIKLS